ncbi:hypothetical protein CEXT_721161 [Caerostris extrusa]|uniref:Uncharacterized protein n=1 Tax=Caerostris extrusa TaxID=172846 RepID=A0AAV4V965_CAEEX|nr:hypothetical protein CEXT_721161 [Caerostris extrusa]
MTAKVIVWKMTAKVIVWKMTAKVIVWKMIKKVIPVWKNDCQGDSLENDCQVDGQTGFSWIAIITQLSEEGWIYHVARHAEPFNQGASLDIMGKTNEGMYIRIKNICYHCPVDDVVILRFLSYLLTISFISVVLSHLEEKVFQIEITLGGICQF